ncbi:sensor histidine kinase [Angustibacter aerolatus]
MRTGQTTGTRPPGADAAGSVTRAVDEPAGGSAVRTGRRRAGWAGRLAHRAGDALDQLVGGLATAVLALVTLLAVLLVAVLSLVGLGLPLVVPTLRLVRAVADRERQRLQPGAAPSADVPGLLREALRELGVRRELGWLPLHGAVGLLAGLVGLTLPLTVVQDLTFPLWYRLLSPGSTTPTFVTWSIEGLPDALLVALLGVPWLAAFLLVEPWIARAQALPGRLLLLGGDRDALSRRVAELTATRAAALDAHAAELRRIERALHDGAQNRLVAANLLVGSAARAVQLGRPDAADLLERAQVATETALAELRGVVRDILPPVLADRGLAEALGSLAAASVVPCTVDVDLLRRCPATVEATAWFAVAEALTNVARHSGATSARVTVRLRGDELVLRVADDGRGGAAERPGSGLAGLRRRLEALDGRLVLDSPAGGPTAVEAVLPCGW